MKIVERPRVGDQAWHVDWCANIPLDEFGDADIDRADDRCEVVPSRSEAERRAAEVLPRDAFGQVSITPVEFVAYDDEDSIRFPRAGFWEPTGESKYMELDD